MENIQEPVKSCEIIHETTSKNLPINTFPSEFANECMFSELSIINQTKQILEESMEIYYQNNEKYYKDVLSFLNKLYSENSKSILKIKFKKITFNEDIFNKYNKIIKKYNLNKDLFDTLNFNIDDVHDFNDIIEISQIMSNNLLEKLNFRINQININGKKILKIIITN